MQRFFTLFLLIPLLLLSACSDDDGDAAATSTPAASAATATPPASDATAPAATGVAKAAVSGTLKVDFTGAPEELEAIEAPFEVAPGSTAWDAVKLALGEDNVAFQDFGGDLGIFVSGFNGVEAEGNHFWEFKINGESAEAGVGKYEVQQGDVIEFVYSSF